MDIEASLRKEERVDFSFWALVIVEKKKKSSVTKKPFIYFVF